MRRVFERFGGSGPSDRKRFSGDFITIMSESNFRHTQVALVAGIAKSTYLPRITAAAIGGYQVSQTSTTTEAARGTISTVSFQWLLFDFGQRAAVVEAAQQGSVISNIGFTAAHQQLIHDVSLAFYANAAARARVGNAAQSLKNAKSVQAAVEDRMKRGIRTTIEVAQARQSTAQARLAMVQATGAARTPWLERSYCKRETRRLTHTARHCPQQPRSPCPRARSGRLFNKVASLQPRTAPEPPERPSAYLFLIDSGKLGEPT